MAKKINSEAPVLLLISIPRALVEKIEAEWHRRKLSSRAATVRALLQEALAK